MFPVVLNLLCLMTVQPSPTQTTPQDVVALAYRNRHAVKASLLKIESARLSSRSLAAGPAPRIELQSASNQNLRGNDDDLVLAQPVDLFGRSRAGRRVGEAQVDIAKTERRGVLANVQEEVLRAFGEAASLKEKARIADAQVSLVEKILAATKKRAEAGIIPPVQVQRVALELESARQVAAGYESARESATQRLAGAVGVEPTDLGELAFGPIESKIDSQKAENLRFDLVSLRASQKLLAAEIERARSENRPELEVSLRTSPWTYPDNQTGLRATFSIPLGSRRVRSEIAALLASQEAAASNLEDLKRSLESELQALQIEQVSANRQLEGAQKLAASARQLVRASEIGYAEGATSLLEVLEATRSLRESEEAILEARLRVFRVQTDILKATGTLLVEVSQ